VKRTNNRTEIDNGKDTDENEIENEIRIEVWKMNLSSEMKVELRI